MTYYSGTREGNYFLRFRRDDLPVSFATFLPSFFAMRRAIRT